MTSWNPDVTVRPQPHPASLRPFSHQTTAWDALTRDYRQPNKAGLLVLPTGAGKTYVAAHWLLSNHIRVGGRVLWLAHRRGLLRQAARTFLANANLAHPKPSLGLITLNAEDRSWSQVDREHDAVFSSVQTAARADNFDFIEAYLENAGGRLFVVVDEAHHAAAAGYYRLLTQLRKRNCPLLGLTATPVRMDEADECRLHSLFDRHVIYQVSRRTLIEQGVLAVPSFVTVKTNVEFEREFKPEDIAHLERYGDLAPSVLKRIATHSSRNKLIVAHYVEKRIQYGPTIVFAADTLHARTLSEEFRKAGVSADHVDYARSDSQSVIESYQAGRGPQVLINVEMLTEGFDAPHTRTVFIARPTRSEGLLAQMVGRALRGVRSGGNEKAFLVTFLDTWRQFDVLDAEYALRDGEVEEPEASVSESVPRIDIPPELISEAYRLVQGVVHADFVGVYQCLPHAWYAWEQTYDDDVRRRLVMMFEHQVEGFDALDAKFARAEDVPPVLDENRARELVQEFFADLPDPLPRWADVQALLEARRQGCEVFRYSFDEKRTFDPRVLAKKIVDGALSSVQKQDYLQKLWQEDSACRSVYRDDFRTFLDEVLREEGDLLQPAKPAPLPEVVQIVPGGPPRPWPSGETGYSLLRVRDAVVQNRRNFPSGSPQHGALVWSSRATRGRWGFFRNSDRSVTVSCVLDSPDIPLFVVEFLVFHELLHAEMPHAGHNGDFRARERTFSPSLEAIEQAGAKGVSAGPNPGAWRARAETFLDTFERHYQLKRPGAGMFY